MCDRLVIVDHGRILVEGSPAELILQHAGRSVIEVGGPDQALRDYLRASGMPHDDLGGRLILYEEIILAEIVWSASKAAAAAAIMLAVLSLFGYVAFPAGLLAVPLAFLGGVAFGAIGLFFTGIIPTIEMFNLPIFLFVTPMFLFSGTFFPVSNLPMWAKPAAFAFPLYHLVELTRLVCLGRCETVPALSLAYLVLFAFLFTALALVCMRRRLIK
jgi:lipooligosaccharide transport system permease protein